MNSQKINRQIRLFHGSPIQGLKYNVNNLTKATTIYSV